MPESAASTAGVGRKQGSLFKRKTNARRPGAVTALEPAGTVLRLVQSALRGGQTIVTRIESGPLDPDLRGAEGDPEALGKAMAGVLDDLRLKPAHVVLGVPRHQVVLRTLKLPVMADVREMAAVVHLQVGKDLPFRPEDAVIDFQVRGTVVKTGESVASAERGQSKPEPPGVQPPAAAMVEVLVAAVRRETVEYYQRLAAAAKLKLIALGWISQANARCVEACRVARENETVALVSLRPEEVGIDLVAGRSLLFSRGASLAAGTPSGTTSADPDRPEVRTDFAEAVTIEVVRTLHSYGGTESGSPVGRLAVSGATGQEQAVLEMLQKRLNLPVAMLDPAGSIELPPSGRQQVLGATGALGLALGVNDPEGLPFDFLSPKRPAVRRNTRRIRNLVWLAAGVVLLMAVLGVRGELIKRRLKVQRQLQQELAGEEKKIPIYRRMQLQAAGVQSWIKEERSWLEHLAYLSSVLPGPEDLYVTSISVGSQGNIHLAVQARSGEILGNLDRQLRAAGYQVKPLAITPGNDKHGFNFRSTVELIIPPAMKLDLAKTRTPLRPADDGSLDGKNKTKPKGGSS